MKGGRYREVSLYTCGFFIDSQLTSCIDEIATLMGIDKVVEELIMLYSSQTKRKKHKVGWV